LKECINSKHIERSHRVTESTRIKAAHLLERDSNASTREARVAYLPERDSNASTREARVAYLPERDSNASTREATRCLFRIQFPAVLLE
jgi:hypothetical protein